MEKYLSNLGLSSSQSIIVHSSFRNIKSSYPEITPEDVIKVLKNIITSDGSIIFPAFTYCFKKSQGDYKVFDRINSPSEVGILSEVFRNSDQVIRTSSPTHSFSLWGKAANLVDYRNCPESPLGFGSVIDWLAGSENTYVLLIGVDFSALTLGHYIESISKTPYLSISPWNYLSVLSIGAAISEEQQLKEIPGCSKSFTRFEQYLLKENFISKYTQDGLSSYFLPVKSIIHHGIDFLKSDPAGFLCEKGSCKSCDERHIYMNSLNHNKQW